MNARPHELTLPAFVSILMLSFIWIWRRSFPGSGGFFVVALLAALVVGHLQRRESLRDVGFRLDTVVKASTLLVPLAAVVIALTVFVGHASGSARLPSLSTAMIDVGKLAVFGLAQQYLLLGFFYRRLAEALPDPSLSLLATATVFALFHLPNPFLTAVTFFAGLIAVMVYRRAPNLWVIGIVHGMISYCLYCSLAPELTRGLRVGPGYWMR